MAISPEDRAYLESLGVDNVRQRLSYAGSGGYAVVPGLGRGPGLDLTRSDVEAWLAEKDRAARRLQSDTLWWAKAAAWIGIAGIVVAIAIALAHL